MHVLEQTAHRPWPLPDRPWVMHQRWHDLLFAHWALPPEKIRPLVPRELELDTFGGLAWIGIIPFWMSDVRFRHLPPMPTAHTFPELNVRTYVKGIKQRRFEPEKPGVYFFSLDAGSLLATIGARAWVGLKYFWADMRVAAAGDQIEYVSLRRYTHPAAKLTSTYRPTGSISKQPTELERFLTERYCLYSAHRLPRSKRRVLHRIEIHHLPWPLQPAEAAFEVNTMGLANRIEIPPEQPVLQFAKFLEVYIFAPEKLG